MKNLSKFTLKNHLIQLIKNSKINQLKENQLIKGKILLIEKNFILINFELKNLSKIALTEFSEKEKQNLKIGQEIEVLIENIQDQYGSTIISYEKAKFKKKINYINNYYIKNKLIKGEIIKQIKGGFEVNINDIKVFLPISLSNLNDIKNKKLKFKIIKIDNITNNIIVSRHFNEVKTCDILDQYYVNQVVKGTVKNITNYGAFINLGEIDGLVHITDISWKRIKHPTEILKKNDEINLIILKIDYDLEKIFLGIKQLQKNPWKEISNKYPKGTELIGKITNFTDYGIFVEIEKGIEGLLHNTYLKKNNISKDDLKTNQNINVIIQNVDVQNKKISLNIKKI